MNTFLFGVGRLAGLLGSLLMVAAVVARLMGHYDLAGIGTGTMLLASVGAVSVGCFLLLWQIAARE